MDVSANVTSAVYSIETTGVVVVLVSALSKSTTSTPNVSLNCATMKSLRCAIVILAATLSSIEEGTDPAEITYRTPKGEERRAPFGPAVGASSGMVEVLGPEVREGPSVVKFLMDEGATVELKAAVGIDVGLVPLLVGGRVTGATVSEFGDVVLRVGASVGLRVLLDAAVGAAVAAVAGAPVA